jgi:hypothetical protein
VVVFWVSIDEEVKGLMGESLSSQAMHESMKAGISTI